MSIKLDDCPPMMTPAQIVKAGVFGSKSALDRAVRVSGFPKPLKPSSNRALYERVKVEEWLEGLR